MLSRAVVATTTTTTTNVVVIVAAVTAAAVIIIVGRKLLRSAALGLLKPSGLLFFFLLLQLQCQCEIFISTAVAQWGTIGLEWLVVACIVSNFKGTMSEESVQEISCSVDINKRLPDNGKFMGQTLVRDKGIKGAVHRVLEKRAKMVVSKKGAKVALGQALLENMKSIVRQLCLGGVHKLLHYQGLSNLFVF